MAQRYFVPTLPDGGRLPLDAELAHHVGRVLRTRPGELLRLGDGAGATAVAVVVAVDRHRVEVEIRARRQAPPPSPRVLLAFAPPRLQRAEWLLEHGTEVGVDRFQPLWTARTRPQGERLERWHKIVRAAAGQCDRAWLPTLAPAMELASFLAGPLPADRLVGGLGAPPLSTHRATGATALLVGPEGGFTPEELAAIAGAGFVPRSFGPHTLRTETAAVVGAAILLAAAG
jgi:16S rRNA (uracil1498-N3)-methyltransferase